MASLRVLNTMIFVYNLTMIHKSSADILSASAAKSSLDIHLELQANDTPNLREIIREEIKSVLNDSRTDIGNCTSNNLEENSPITVRSTKDNLNSLSIELQNIKNTLNNLSDNVNSLTKFLEKKKSIGVQYNNFKKTLQTDKHVPKNCKEVQQNGNSASGVYEIYPKYAKAPFPVLCDMETKGGGWIHIQKRFDGSQDFHLKWKDYKFGFGDLDGEFWLGLEKIHLLSEYELTELLVEIVDRDNISAYARYSSFSVGPEPEGYKLNKLSGYTGDAGDSLTYQRGSKFGTSDLDFTGTCTSRFFGGWWYNDCVRSHLNGKYINIDIPSIYRYQGLHWDTFRGADYSHAKSRMLIRPVK